MIAAAKGGLGLALGLAAATLLLTVLTATDQVGTMIGGSHLGDGLFALAFLAYSAVGALIVLRRPENRVGWVFLVSGLGFQLWMFTWRYAAYGLLVRPGSLPASEPAAWLALWVGTIGFGLAFTFLLQLFPDGALPSRRWRPLAWFTTVALLVWAFTWATAPGPLGSFPQVDNPLGLAAVGRLDPGLGWVLFVLAVLASAASLVYRYVGSAGVERRQIGWFVSAAAIIGLALVATTVASEGWRPAELAAGLLFPVAVAAVPAAAFVAIFKHDLYDLDVVVFKTITFGVLAALITGVYVAAVAGIGAAAGAAGELSLPLAVLITAVVAVAFHPARARVKRLANRLVHGPLATPYDVLAEFSRRMGGSLDATAALPEMARIVVDGTGASRAEVWLVVDDRLHRVACWPEEPTRPVLSLTDGGLPPLPGASRTVEVRHHGELLGAIALMLPSGRGLTATAGRLLDDLAAQAGLVLRNVRLVEEARASRQRILAAQDEERRRLERDIHDGVQQRLVTLALGLKMAATQVSVPADGVADTLDAAAGEATEILAELRRLARGIHPAIVSEGGLGAALESLAERAPLPVEVQMGAIERLAAPVEITAYYLVAEALTNTAKHATATTASVTLDHADGRVIVEVVDDGVGGAAASRGSGLAGLTDRVAALGGRLEIASPAGGGTLLRAEIPCASS
jgi:signal transduction histidine kinase